MTSFLDGIAEAINSNDVNKLQTILSHDQGALAWIQKEHFIVQQDIREAPTFLASLVSWNCLYGKI